MIAGVYSFVYLVRSRFQSSVKVWNKFIWCHSDLQSPEAFLNNQLFRDVYFNPIFQSRLSLIVVDEAHMIYVWGLVAKGRSKGIASHGRHPDWGLFRPSYGKLAARLMATNGTPLLLMSATCRPVAIRSILESLKLTEEMVDFVRAELTRTEIRLLRFHATLDWILRPPTEYIWNKRANTQGETCTKLDIFIHTKSYQQSSWGRQQCSRNQSRRERSKQHLYTPLPLKYRRLR